MKILKTVTEFQKTQITVWCSQLQAKRISRTTGCKNGSVSCVVCETERHVKQIIFTAVISNKIDNLLRRFVRLNCFNMLIAKSKTEARKFTNRNAIAHLRTIAIDNEVSSAGKLAGIGISNKCSDVSTDAVVGIIRVSVGNGEVILTCAVIKRDG